MNSEHSPTEDRGAESDWAGPFVARGQRAPEQPADSEVLPPLHLSRTGRAEPVPSPVEPAAREPEDETDEIALLSDMMRDLQPAEPEAEPEAGGPLPELEPVPQPPVEPSESLSAGGGVAWDDEPWANTPISEESDEPLEGLIEGDLLLDLPSVALPVEGLERGEEAPPPAAPADHAGEERDAPDWQQWLQDNREAGVHHFPPLEGSPAEAADVDSVSPEHAASAPAGEDAPTSQMGGDLTGLEHYDWDEAEIELAEGPQPTGAAPVEGLERADTSDAPPAAPTEGLIREGDDGWLDLGEDEMDLPEFAPSPAVPFDEAGAVGAQADRGEADVEEVAERLERIARSLRQHGLTGPLADRDPLGALIAGYLLGSTSRRDAD